jgi:hypothetical protein
MVERRQASFLILAINGVSHPAAKNLAVGNHEIERT